MVDFPNHKDAAALLLCRVVVWTIKEGILHKSAYLINAANKKEKIESMTYLLTPSIRNLKMTLERNEKDIWLLS